MSREQNIDALGAAIRKLIEVLIARDQGHIGVHERATEAQQNLRDALRAALEERAANLTPTET
jgi:hypothetical protein